MLTVQELRRAAGVARYTPQSKYILQILSILDDCCQEILDRVEDGEELDEVPASSKLFNFLHQLKAKEIKLLDQPELFKPTYPDDITKIRSLCPEVKNLNDFIVEQLWENYSEDCYCAGWLMVPDDLSDFVRYIDGPKF